MSLDNISVARINKSLGILEKYGHTARYPHTKHIADGVFELRVIGMKNIRIFFVFNNDEAVILHTFVKKTQKAPRKEIEYAVSLKNKLQ